MGFFVFVVLFAGLMVPISRRWKRDWAEIGTLKANLADLRSERDEARRANVSTLAAGDMLVGRIRELDAQLAESQRARSVLGAQSEAMQRMILERTRLALTGTELLPAGANGLPTLHMQWEEIPVAASRH